jgi:hypothetical protein
VDSKTTNQFQKPKRGEITKQKRKPLNKTLKEDTKNHLDVP